MQVLNIAKQIGAIKFEFFSFQRFNYGNIKTNAGKIGKKHSLNS